MIEVAGNMHIHTRYSDGYQWHDAVATAAIEAGLDFIIVTDHNVWVRGVEGYYQRDNGRVLLMTGEEIHNVRRQPQASHLLVYNAGTELAPYAADPQQLIDETVSRGAYCFLAHPFERDLPLINSPDLGWHDWDIEGFTGLEIWNYMSSVKNAIADRLDELPIRNRLLDALFGLRLALQPEATVVGPERKTLALWDEFLARGMRVAAVGNADAHGTPMSLGPIKREIYPYDFLFRAVNTHLLLPRDLNGDIDHDRALILRAIGRGQSWVGYDMAHTTKGFRFTVQGERRGYMGDEMVLGTGATLQISAPARCRIRLIRHGELVAHAEQATNLTYVPAEPGAYRVECLIPYMGRERGWIFSNPIYLR